MEEDGDLAEKCMMLQNVGKKEEYVELTGPN